MTKSQEKAHTGVKDGRKDGKTEGQKDGQTLFHWTLLANAGGPIKKFCILQVAEFSLTP